jgi:hypothetical protein
MKKQFFFTLLLIWGLTGFSQNGMLKGIVRHGISSELSPFVNIMLVRTADGKTIQATNSDTVGKFEFRNIPEGVYNLNFSFVSYNSFMFEHVTIKKDTAIYLSIQFPCPNGTKSAKKKCPFGHRDNIIPISYGLHSEKSLKKAEQGKIELGGCMVTECDPKWYCKTHKIRY